MIGVLVVLALMAFAATAIYVGSSRRRRVKVIWAELTAGADPAERYHWLCLQNTVPSHLVVATDKISWVAAKARSSAEVLRLADEADGVPISDIVSARRSRSGRGVVLELASRPNVLERFGSADLHVMAQPGSPCVDLVDQLLDVLRSRGVAMAG